MYKQFKNVDERDRRIYMAGLSLIQLIGWKNPREYCMNTVLAIGDVDTDDMLFFSNSIDRDIEHLEEDHTQRFSDYFATSVGCYVDEEYRDAAQEFFSLEHLRDSFERGRMIESMDYPCHVLDDTVWIRACYELDQDDEGHIISTVVLIDTTAFHDTFETVVKGS